MQQDGAAVGGLQLDRRRVIEFLNQAQQTGELVQQEAGSMLPALALQPLGPGDLVLDLCSAPGSKTLQLLDGMSRDRQGDIHGCDRGLLIANDVSRERVERTSRRCGFSGLSSLPLVVTVCDATKFPTSLRLPGHPGEAGGPLRFSRVLCDVPCSGDGTLRKSPEKWDKWSVRPALGNHPLQLAILLRGLELLATGGRLVYSTCSLNPLENEAVVWAALSRCADKGMSVELMEPSAALPFGSSPTWCDGLSTWVVPDPNFSQQQVCYGSWDEVPQKVIAAVSRLPHPLLSGVRAVPLFPLTFFSAGTWRRQNP